MSLMTPDGLIIYEQPGVGLVVSAADHNFMLSKWERELAALLSGPRKEKQPGEACCGQMQPVARAGYCYDQLSCSACGAYLGEPAE